MSCEVVTYIETHNKAPPCVRRGEKESTGKGKGTDLEVVVEGLMDPGHHVGTVGQWGLDLLEPIGQQRQLLSVERGEKEEEEGKGGISECKGGMSE